MTTAEWVQDQITEGLVGQDKDISFILRLCEDSFDQAIALYLLNLLKAHQNALYVRDSKQSSVEALKPVTLNDWQLKLPISEPIVLKFLYPFLGKYGNRYFYHRYNTHTQVYQWQMRCKIYFLSRKELKIIKGINLQL